MSRERDRPANNVLQTVEHQLAKATASRDLAKLDLERTVIRAPADGWVTNLNVYRGEFITRGSTAVALVKQNTFYVMAYLEETKLEGVRPGFVLKLPLWVHTLRGPSTASLLASPMPAAAAIQRSWPLLILILEWVRRRSDFQYVFALISSRAISGQRAPRRRW